MQDLLNNWWQLRTSTDIASRETAKQMESWLEGYEEYAMQQVGEICKLVKKDGGEVLELKRLYLDNNNLTTLPAEIGFLQELKRLDLDNNNLTTLPAEIVFLQALKRLYLNNNNLTTLPAEIGFLQELKWLDLDGNKLTSLPDEIGFLQGLEMLYLQGNPISKTEQQRIKSLQPNCIIYF